MKTRVREDIEQKDSLIVEYESVMSGYDPSDIVKQRQETQYGEFFEQFSFYDYSLKTELSTTVIF
jgi:hypothetical protein